MSEPSHANFSHAVNAESAETGNGSTTGHVPVANPVIILRVIFLLTMAVINLCGNGFTLITIWRTPRLWTKTNFILASMLVSDCITGVFMFWYTPLLLVVYVFNDPCKYNVIMTVADGIFKIAGFASCYHLILISVERYTAIVYPLHYETKFTDRTVKWAISACWVSGVLIPMTFSLWLINADLRKCVLIPAQYYLVTVIVFYIPACISMLVCYGKIFAISWRQRQQMQRIVNPAPETPGQAIALTTLSPTQNNTVVNTADPEETSPADTGPPASPAVTCGAASAEWAEQQRQKLKSRRREFKAAYLTGAIVGAFVVLWFPSMLGRVLYSASYDPIVVNYLFLVGGAIASLNFAFSWAIYAAVSKSYRRAYRQMLIRIGCCWCKNVTLPADN